MKTSNSHDDEKQESPLPESETLRTRIAAVIAKADQDWCSDNDLYADMADAVIRELGLEPQAHYDPCCDHYRYVTDWIAP